MTAGGTLIELGERYAALGLPAAARGALTRALQGDEAAAAAARLVELCLASGDAAAALRFARELAAREPGPAVRVLLGRAQLAAGELAAARRSFAMALEAGTLSRLARARALQGRAQVALREGDPTGAGAHTMAALGELLDALATSAQAGQEPASEDEAELAPLFRLAEELMSQAVALGRADDVDGRVDELAAARPQAPWRLLRALAAIARQTHGDAAVADATIDELLDGQLEIWPARLVRLRRIERRLRRRSRDAAARAATIAELEALAAELAREPATLAHHLELARLYFLLAAAHEEDPSGASRAEAAYRRGLTLRPGHAPAVHRLAALALARADHDGAAAEIERALRVDGGHGVAWRHAARLVEASSPGAPMTAVLERILDAASPGAGAVAGAATAELVAAAVEVARSELLAGMYTRGHRMKNLLGIVGARARSARKLAGDGDLGERLRGLEADITGLYEEWGAYLRSMQTAGPVIEAVPVAPLVADVLDVAGAGTAVTITRSVPAGLPELRGDRMMLREALLNLVTNAAEACAAGGGRVEVSVRALGAIVEIVVADTGPGIPRAELTRVFAPGYTTKEAGSGIGLAIAERVVAAHHGRLELDSEEGRGTRVTIALPVDLGGFAALGQLGGTGAE